MFFMTMHFVVNQQPLNPLWLNSTIRKKDISDLMLTTKVIWGGYYICTLNSSMTVIANSRSIRIL